MSPHLQHPHPLRNIRQASHLQAPSYNTTDTSILFQTNHEASQTMLLDMTLSSALHTGNDDTTSFSSPPQASSSSSSIGSPLMSLPVFGKTGNSRRGPLSSTRSPSSSKQPLEEEEEIIQDDRHTMKEIVNRLDKVGLRESLRGTGKLEKENRASKAEDSTLNLGRYDDTVGASVLFKLDKEMKPIMAESFMVMPSSSDTSTSTLFSDTSEIQPPPEPAWKQRLSQQQTIQRGSNTTPHKGHTSSAVVGMKDRTPITSAATASYKPLLPKSISTPVISRVSAAAAGSRDAPVKGIDEHTPVRRAGIRAGQDSTPGEAKSAVRQAGGGRTPAGPIVRGTSASSRSPAKLATQGTPLASQPNITRSRYGRSPMATATSNASKEAHTPLSKPSTAQSRDSTPRRTLAPVATSGLASRSPRKVPLPASPSLPSLAQLKAGEASAPTTKSSGLARSRSIASNGSARITGSRNVVAIAERAQTTYSRDFFEKMRGNQAPSAQVGERAGTALVPPSRRGIPSSASATGIASIQSASLQAKSLATSPNKAGTSSLAGRSGLSSRAEDTNDDVLARAAKRAEMRRAAEINQAGPSSRQSAIGPVRNSVSHSSSTTSISNLRRSIPRPESSIASTAPAATASGLPSTATASKRDEYRSIPRSRSSTRDLSKSTSSLASSTSSNKLSQAQAQASGVPATTRQTGLSRSTRASTASTSSFSHRQSEAALPPLPSASRPLPVMPSRRSGLPVSQSSSSISSLSALAGTKAPTTAGGYARSRGSAVSGQSGIARLPKSYSARGVNGLT